MIRTPCVSVLVFFLHAILSHNLADAKNLVVSAGPTPSAPSALTAKALIMQAMQGHYGESCVDVTSKAATSAKVEVGVVSNAESVTLNCSETTSALTLTTERKPKRSSAFICSKTESGVSTNLGFAASDADPTSQFISLARSDSNSRTSTGLYCNASKDFEKLLEVQAVKALGPIIQQANLAYQCASLSAGSAKPSPTTYSFDGKNLSLFGKTYSIEKDLSSEKFTAGANANSLSLALTTGDTIQLDLSRDGKSLAMIRLLSGALMTTCLPKKSP